MKPATTSAHELRPQVLVIDADVTQLVPAFRAYKVLGIAEQVRPKCTCATEMMNHLGLIDP